MLTLRPVTAETYWDIIDLSVSPEQSDYVTTNAVSLGQAYVQPECIPRAIYADEQPVGFLMYCVDRDDNEYWLYRLMIDRRFQGRGYARKALEALLDELRRDRSRHCVYLGVHPEAHAAVKLYESLGFAPTGQVFGKERVYRLSY